MSLAETFVESIFRFAAEIITTALFIAALFWIMPLLWRQMSKHIGGRWGQPDGTLHMLSPRRLWCRHPVAYYGQGTYGRWSMWCDLCGREARGR